MLRPNVHTGEYQLLTLPGPAAIAQVRARGAGAATFLSRHCRFASRIPPRPRRAGAVLRAELIGSEGEYVDDILVTFGVAGTEDVRLHLHGNPWLVEQCTRLLSACGLREREETHTTVWPTTDVLEAEAMALLPKMLTLRGSRWLVDQVTKLRAEVTRLLDVEDVERVRESCRALAARLRFAVRFSSPYRIALVGPPNAGKSTLANRLADRTVSLVSSTPGTTRDWVEVAGEVNGFPVVWLDTAGLRASSDPLECAGMAATRSVIESADAAVLVLDEAGRGAPTSASLPETPVGTKLMAVAWNKMDLHAQSPAPRSAFRNTPTTPEVRISAATGEGLEQLLVLISSGMGADEQELESPCAITERQSVLLRRAIAEAELSACRRSIRQLISDAADHDSPDRP